MKNKKLEKQLKDVEKILENLNKTFKPITNEIEQNLKKLEDITDVKEDYNFKPFTMDDLK